MENTHKKVAPDFPVGSIPSPARVEGWSFLPLAYKFHPLLLALRAITHGTLDLYLPKNIHLRYTGRKSGAQADIRFHDWKSLDRVNNHGDIGWGEDYALGL